MAGGVFISYRREDSGGYAGRIYDRLASRLGRENVFFDVDTIPLGRDFVEVLSENIGRCDALIAVIGKQWVTMVDGENRRRLDDLKDFVRIEVEAALSRNVPVIPVLVDGAKMPREEDLPDGLKTLPRRQAIEISLARFDTDAERLTDALAEIEAARSTPTAPAADRKVLAAFGLAFLAALVIAGGMTAVYLVKGGSKPEEAAADPKPAANVAALSTGDRAKEVDRSSVGAVSAEVRTVNAEGSPSGSQAARTGQRAMALVSDAAASICAEAKDPKGNDADLQGTVLGQLGNLIGDIAGVEPTATPSLGPDALRTLAKDATAIALRGETNCRASVTSRMLAAFAAPSQSVTVKAGDCGIAAGGNATGNSIVCGGGSAKPQ